jgi:hypothetical protein
MKNPASISKAIGDFCDLWANRATVAGLLLSVFGFGFTIWGILRTKKAAERAVEAANQTKEKILKQGTLANFSSAIAMMEEIIRVQRKKEWGVSLDRYSELRRVLVELRDGSGGLTQEHQIVIQGTVEQFKTIEKQIDRHVSSGKPEPDIAKINGVVTNQIMKVHGIAINLKNS